MPFRHARLIESLVEAFDEYGGESKYATASTDDCDPIEQYTRKFNYPPKNRLKDKRDLNVLGIKTFVLMYVPRMTEQLIFN